MKKAGLLGMSAKVREKWQKEKSKPTENMTILDQKDLTFKINWKKKTEQQQHT